MNNPRRALPPLIAFVLVVAVAALAAGLWTRSTPMQKRKRGLLAQIRPMADDVSPNANPSEGADDRGVLAQEAMADWRSAILARNPEMVGRLDAAFLEAPDTYVNALRDRACSDDDDRVRAFSTRELGKFRRPDLVPVFDRLLDDKSPFVRKNASWALGELSGQRDTRATVRHEEARLRHLAETDAVEDVRVAARNALGQFQ